MSNPYLTRLSDNKSYVLKNESINGRQKTCDVILDDEEGISRNHAEIRISGDVITIRDLNSTNGILVNNVRVGIAQVLRPNDVLIFDEKEYRLDLPDSTLEESTEKEIEILPTERESSAINLNSQEIVLNERFTETDQKLIAEQWALEADENEIVEQQNQEAEEQRIEDQKAQEAEQQRIADQKAQEAEQQRIADQKAQEAEQQRIADQKAQEAEEQHIADQKAQKAEQQRIADQKALNKEKSSTPENVTQNSTQEPLERREISWVDTGYYKGKTRTFDPSDGVFPVVAEDFKNELNHPSILIQSGTHAGTVVSLDQDKSEWMVGSSDVCDVVINDQGVSAKHAKLSRQGSKWQIFDQMAVNNTFLNNNYVATGYLADGDVIRFGPVSCKFGLPLNANSKSGGKRKNMNGPRVLPLAALLVVVMAAMIFAGWFFVSTGLFDSILMELKSGQK